MLAYQALPNGIDAVDLIRTHADLQRRDDILVHIVEERDGLWRYRQPIKAAS